MILSSVSALTVLPEAVELATTQKKCHTTAFTLRRFRFITFTTAYRQYFDLDEAPDHAHNPNKSSPINVFADDDCFMTGDGTHAPQSFDVNSMSSKQHAQCFSHTMKRLK